MGVVRVTWPIFGRPFVKRFAPCYQTVVCPVCLKRWCTVAKRFDGSRWNLARREASAMATLYKMGTQLPSPKKGASPPPKRVQSPQFSDHVYCGQTAGWIKMPLGMEVGLGPGHTVIDGNPPPLPQKGAQPPNFWRLQWLRLRIGISHCKRWSNVSEKHGHQFHCQHFNILSVLCLTVWKRSLKINETSFRTNSGQ